MRTKTYEDHLCKADRRAPCALPRCRVAALRDRGWLSKGRRRKKAISRKFIMQQPGPKIQSVWLELCLLHSHHGHHGCRLPQDAKSWAGIGRYNEGFYSIFEKARLFSHK